MTTYIMRKNGTPKIYKSIKVQNVMFLPLIYFWVN